MATFAFLIMVLYRQIHLKKLSNFLPSKSDGS